MTQKIEKIKTEIGKLRQKAEEIQQRIIDLEQQQTDLENTEIIMLCRSADIPLTRLAAVLNSCKTTGNPEPRAVSRPPAASYGDTEDTETE